MANRLPQPVGYRPFRVQPILQEGVLPSPRDDGELERKVSIGLARMADEFGQQADRQAMLAGQKAGEAEALAGAPGASTVTGDAVGPVDGPRQGRLVNPKAANAEAAKARDYLVAQHGFSPAQAAAFVGHGMQESAFDTQASGDNGSAFGIMQWRGDRQTALRQFAAKSGRNVVDLPTQLDFAVSELKSTEKSAGDKFFASGNVQDAVSALMSYERPAGWTPGNPTAGHGYDNRLGYALSFAPADGGQPSAVAAPDSAVPAPSDGAAKPTYRSMPSASSVAPVSVTPVSVPVKIEPGKAGTFRPKEGDTIYARAYNVAGEKTYIQQLELTLLQDQDAVYDKYKDDPAMLQKAYGELLQAHKQEHLFPEIEADYTAAYNKRAYGLVRQAQDAQQTRIKQQDRGDFLGRVGTLEDTKSRAMAGIDFKSDSAPARLADLQATIDDHYDTAVAKGVISAADAERAKRASRGDMMVTYYTKQAQSLPADDIASMRKSMTADYSAGKLDGVDADSWDKIDAGMMAAERARRTQDEKSDKDLTKRGEDFASRIARGMPVSADEFARFQLDAATAPKGSEIVGSTLTRMKVSDAIRTLPIEEVEKRLPSLLGDKATADDRDFSRKLIESHRKELQTDPIGVAERFGILPPSAGLPIDGDADPSTVSGAFSERINQAEAVARHFGVQPKYFRPGEVDQIEKTVTTDPERGVSIAAGLVDAAGRNAPQVLRELGQDAPAVSGAGEIMALGGNVKAARDLLAGYGKTPDGKAYPDMKVTARVPQAQKIAGGALVFSPDQVNSLDAQAAAIARKRLYDAGIDPKTPDAKPIYERAFQEAAGASFAGSVQYGGFAGYDRGMFYREKQVLVPPTVRADRFGTVIEAISDADLGGVKAKNGRAWTAADFQKAMPVAVDGGYVFALGDPASSTPMFIAGEDGKPILLDLGNMGALKKRVPEAFK
ncbi:hypothetical protein GOZ80_14080 [Agrobacterium vitis]|uniref:Phage tail lysozyme domain-containing protein n=1 Tax=Agrobacterium vitis TaxID=373 RepID=A0A1S2DZE7_AGRVI|nr:phage tail tip lysozyme [Agrobacterium vitis]KAA3526127.1 hypothetical protein DXT89_16515 [Agrobacterium vitis]MUO96604.1 hypothetical protein [Agrobacterium vitis]MUZ99363.1 hypothetical protein [Agrobacterium vitis]MVA93135.1 hypothetical protein [Agrobacterium vitis]MVB04018.1 hypothetical protein [Agrobacterium vitis]